MMKSTTPVFIAPPRADFSCCHDIITINEMMRLDRCCVKCQCVSASSVAICRDHDFFFSRDGPRLISFVFLKTSVSNRHFHIAPHTSISISSSRHLAQHRQH